MLLAGKLVENTLLKHEDFVIFYEENKGITVESFEKRRKKNIWQEIFTQINRPL